MKVSLISGLSVLFSGSVSAQYFSAGWSPGQQVAETQASDGWSTDQPIPTIVQTQQSPGSFEWSKLLTSGPLRPLFSMAGIDVTKYMDDATNGDALLWDKRIPQITDDNYDDMIVNESLTEQAAKDRVWCLIITVARGSNGALSKVVDSVFDAAYNLSVAENDLKNVRWGRIDYMSVTTLTTKWAVWQVPRLVIVTERGRTLRFFKPNRVDEEAIRSWLKGEYWREHEPWNSQYAPGGDREWIMNVLALIATRYYNLSSRMPNWLMLIMTGSIASIILRMSHRSTPARPQQQRTVHSVSTPETRSTPSEAEVTSTTVKQSNKEGKRKGKK